jgi:hypothetical protein
MMSEEYNDSTEGRRRLWGTNQRKLSDEEQLKQAAKEFKEAWQDESWWERRTLGEKIVMGIGFGILFLGFLVLARLRHHVAVELADAGDLSVSPPSTTGRPGACSS